MMEDEMKERGLKRQRVRESEITRRISRRELLGRGLIVLGTVGSSLFFGNACGEEKEGEVGTQTSEATRKPPEADQSMPVEKLQEDFKELGYEIEEFGTDKKVNLADFRGQKLAVLIFVPDFDRSSLHEVYLQAISQAIGETDFKPIYIYSGEEIREDQKDELQRLRQEFIGENTQLYILRQIPNVDQVPGVRPGTDSPELYLVDKNGIVENQIADRRMLTSDQLIQLVNKMN